jgi:hypothetical protein
VAGRLKRAYNQFNRQLCNSCGQGLTFQVIAGSFTKMELMKLASAVLFIFVLSISCRKEPCKNDPPAAHPDMQYHDLKDIVIRFNQHKMLDLDGDHNSDLLFSTMLVGDPVLQRDRRQYSVSADLNVNLSINNSEETMMLTKDAVVTIRNFEGYNWWNGNTAVLAEKIIERSGNEYWQGNWKNSSHQYLPVQVMKNNLRYNGWVELSFDTNDGYVTLHRSALCKEAEKEIKAGH